MENELIIQRVNEIRSHFGLSKIEFSNKLELDQANVSKILGGKRPIGKNVIDRICRSFDINKEWLTTGQGAMLNEEGERKEGLPTATKGLPYFDVDITLGTIDLMNDQTTVPAYYIDVPAFRDCDCAVPVYGRSMIPDISDGSVIAVKEISIDDVLPGEAYLIVTDSYRTVKYLRSCKEDSTKIRLVPRNIEEYDETIIDKAKIRRVFLVKGVITNKVV